MAAPKSLPSGGVESRLNDGAAAPSRVRRLWLSAASIGFSLATTALLLKPAQPSDGSTPFGDFRGFFAFDQLSYAAIATTAATGNLSRVEPFTETGVSYYPSLWYRFLGLASSYLEIGVPAAWTVLGTAVVALLIVAMGLLAISISGRPWTACLVGPALWIGPLAMAFVDTWYLPLASHAKLWGPYGLLFPLNAEAVGISLAAVSMGLAVWASVGNTGTRLRIWIFSLTAFSLGLLANIHTYAFLIATTLALAWLAVLGIGQLDRRARRVAIALSLAIIGSVFVMAQVLTDMDGSLFLFGLMALAALPGIAPLAMRHVRKSVLFGALYLAGALPQLIHLGFGLGSGDPFLEYRQVQSALLAVPLLPFLAASAPIGAWVATLLVLRRRVCIAAPLEALAWASAITIPLLTFNGYWGFAQEPYRMWIGSVALSSIVLVLPTAAVAARIPLTESRGTKVTSLASISIILIALSWWNLGGFRTAVDAAGAVQFGSSRIDALRQITPDLNGLMIADPCIDLQDLKVVSNSPVAYYNPGLAWPANRGEIDLALTERSQGVLDANSLRQAQVEFVVTDSRCETPYKPTVETGYLLLRMLEYRSGNQFGTFEVWRVI